MKNIIDQYKDAIQIWKCSRLQKQIFATPHEQIACDTETTGLLFNEPSWLCVGDPEIPTEPGKRKDIEVTKPYVFGISLAIPLSTRIALVWARRPSLLYLDTLHLLQRENTAKIWHNAKYDWRACEENKIWLEGEQHDTLTMSRIYWDQRYSHSEQALSEYLCPAISDWKVPITSELKRLRSKYTRAGYPKDYINYSFLPDKMIGQRSMKDSFMCLVLYNFLREKAIW